jgi:hypothetical protein
MVVLYFLTSEIFLLCKYIVITREGELGVTKRTVYNEFRREGLGREEGAGLCVFPSQDRLCCL